MIIMKIAQTESTTYDTDELIFVTLPKESI